MPHPDQHTLRIPADVWTALTERAPAGKFTGSYSTSKALARIVRRYVALVTLGAPSVREKFTAEEIALIADVRRTQGTDDIEQAFTNVLARYGEKHAIVQTLKTIRTLTDAEKIALSDAVDLYEIAREGD